MAGTTSGEFYSISDAAAQRDYVGARGAAEWVGFFLPHLSPGYTVLDCGCGVGSITLDLAERAAPGRVVGVDMDDGQLAIARAHAARRRLANVSFERGDVYSLRFEGETFDAVLAHTLLYHLSDPLRALREIRRVLKPGGVAGVADDAFHTVTYSPDLPCWPRLNEIWGRVVRYNGGNPFYSPHLRGLMLEAGFARTQGHAVAAEHYGTLDETRRFARFVTGVMSSPDLIRVVTAERWATEAELDALRAEVERWGERPDAFFAVMYCAAVGWK